MNYEYSKETYFRNFFMSSRNPKFSKKPSVLYEPNDYHCIDEDFDKYIDIIDKMEETVALTQIEK